MELLVLVGGLVALDLLAYRFGAESRDGFRVEPHRPRPAWPAEATERRAWLLGRLHSLR